MTMDDYLSSSTGRASFLNKVDRIADVLSDINNIMIIELWNEINAVAAPETSWREWTEAMLPELRTRFPNSLIVQSMGSFDSPRAFDGYAWLCSLSDNAFNQAHRYLDLGAKLAICKEPMDILCADAITWLREHGNGKPAILAEGGAVEPCHAAPSTLYARDHEGVMLHDILFAPFFAGSAGPGQCWHWDYYLEKNDLWHQFKTYATASTGVDPIAEGFTPIRMEHPSLRIYGLKGITTDLYWCRDSGSDWRSELLCGVPAKVLQNITLPIGKKVDRAEAYLPWEDCWLPLACTGGMLSLPPFKRSSVIKICNRLRH